MQINKRNRNKNKKQKLTQKSTKKLQIYDFIGRIKLIYIYFNTKMHERKCMKENKTLLLLKSRVY